MLKARYFYAHPCECSGAYWFAPCPCMSPSQILWVQLIPQFLSYSFQILQVVMSLHEDVYVGLDFWFVHFWESYALYRQRKKLVNIIHVQFFSNFTGYHITIWRYACYFWSIHFGRVLPILDIEKCLLAQLLPQFVSDCELYPFSTFRMWAQLFSQFLSDTFQIV